MRKLLLLLLFLALPASPGVYWVVETVAADTVGTVDTYASPYGIQAAFTAASTAGDEVRIVDGTNNYNSSSTSWTNRAADKAIDSGGTGTTDAAIKISCWTNESTRCTTVGCCQLDFNTGTGNGFDLTHTHNVFTNIRASNAATDGFDLSATGDYVTFIECQADGNGGDGIDSAGIHTKVSGSLLNGNTASGIDLNTNGVIVHSEVYGNADGVSSVLDSIAVMGNLIYDNTDDGIALGRDYWIVSGNTIHSNDGDGIDVAAASERAIITRNLLTSNGAYGLNTTAGSNISLIQDNNYYNNTTAARNLSGTVDDDRDTTPDTGAVSYVSATDLEVSSGGGYTWSFPRGTTDWNGKKGGVPAVTPAAGGGTVSYGSVQ
jgi:hypothetical protein